MSLSFTSLSLNTLSHASRCLVRRGLLYLLLRPCLLRPCLLLPLLLLPLCLVSGAHAQEEAESPGELEVEIAQGIQLRRSGRDREALETFKRAEALAPGSARVQVHLAGTYQALGEWLRADDYLRQALAQASDPFIVQHQATLQLAQRTIADNIGQIEVDGSPAGAEVRINGRLVGQLPLAQPIRVVAGSYTLDLSRAGFYPARRPINVMGGELWREVLHLAVDSAGVAGGAAPRPPAGVQVRDAAPSRLPWLPWVLGGLGVTSAGVGTLAWFSRERHAERWNDDERCQRPGQTREQVCGAERVASERAETVLLLSSLAAGLFAGSTVLTLALDEPAAAPQAQLACELRGVWLACAAHF